MHVGADVEGHNGRDEKREERKLSSIPMTVQQALQPHSFRRCAVVSLRGAGAYVLAWSAALTHTVCLEARLQPAQVHWSDCYMRPPQYCFKRELSLLLPFAHWGFQAIADINFFASSPLLTSLSVFIYLSSFSTIVR